MKIAVVCANGRAGRLVVKEAVERGLDVTAVVREDNQSVAHHVIKKDLYVLMLWEMHLVHGLQKNFQDIVRH